MKVGRGLFKAVVEAYSARYASYWVSEGEYGRVDYYDDKGRIIAAQINDKYFIYTDVLSENITNRLQSKKSSVGKEFMSVDESLFYAVVSAYSTSSTQNGPYKHFYDLNGEMIAVETSEGYQVSTSALEKNLERSTPSKEVTECSFAVKVRQGKTLDGSNFYTKAEARVSGMLNTITAYSHRSDNADAARWEVLHRLVEKIVEVKDNWTKVEID